MIAENTDQGIERTLPRTRPIRCDFLRSDGGCGELATVEIAVPDRMLACEHHARSSIEDVPEFFGRLRVSSPTPGCARGCKRARPRRGRV